ncbi:autotransporter assembly complex protein TamA [Gilvimarinus sp. 1_MG-2023]|uniref:autotransporter assembly complex protein TamA n=1 Tax=Gilvimarinus sp. 1_MG-2023 TaxID=3062638 RepID=UPI0026E1F5E1|nr:autotransporter assembly complex family protein [Gilvimarinus sp. 1_MG-2023]MDO6746496.1 autotransporter assembly complex family protein [Gilvimarinus sp. 1_MG-2023]
MSPAFSRSLIFAFLMPLCALAATPSLELTGAEGSLRDNIHAYLGISGQDCEATSWRLASYANQADTEIRDAGRALGYYQLTSQMQIEQTDDCWVMQVEVTPGPRVTYVSVTAQLEGEGKTNAAMQRALASNPMVEGGYFHHGQYESFKSALLQQASVQGFFDASFVSAQALVSQQDNSARVSLVLDTGPRYRIGDISISHDILSRSLIDRYVNLESGQAYRSGDLVDLKSEFQASQYFSSVAVEPQLDELADGKVPINIDLQSGAKHHYLVGAGYSSDTGARVRLGYENRYINDAGHHLNLNVNASEVITTYQVDYSIPMWRPAYQTLRLYTGFSQEDINQSVSNRLASGVNYSSWNNSDWFNHYGLSVEEEEFYFGDGPITTSELIIPMFSTTYTTTTDSVKYPRRGWSVFVRLKGASESTGSSTNFAQAFGRFKFILPAGEGRLLFRLDGGITEVDDFSKLPISQRFFAGGDASIRGYDYKNVGPLNDDDIVIGGSRLLTGSIEYDRKVYGDVVLAAFVDEGSAFNGSYVESYRGVGMGVRWLSPVGPVRADIAKALDGHKGWRLHLSVGPDL